MTAAERRTSITLAVVLGLRMLGLFLILPVFSVHASGLPGGEQLGLVGLAIGIYGLTQALLQLPFGLASDRLGRKPVIVAGLLVFALGSFVAAASDDLVTIIIGRALQGAGAVSAAVTALLADCTRDTVRTKAMAMVGAAIGSSFILSLVAAPWLYGHVGMGGLFALTGILALGAAVVVLRVRVPPDTPAPVAIQPGDWRVVLTNAELWRLNVGICTLQTVQLALFVVVPRALVEHAGIPLAQHGWVYLPVVLLSFLIMLPPLLWGERRGRVRTVFLSGIALLLISQATLPWTWTSATGLIVLLTVYFVGFNLLEASLPSLVSRMAPGRAKGMALGVYNTAQSVGLFAGGALGGWVGQRWGEPAVFIVCACLLAIWLVVAWPMRPPARGVRGPAELAQAAGQGN